MNPKEFFEKRASRPFKKPRKTRALEVPTPVIVKRSKAGAYATVRGGYRSDLKLVVRSAWEAAVLRVIAAYGIPYEYEPETYLFPIKRGNTTYTPDIRLKKTGEFIEVKGYMDSNSKMKLKRFAKFYPEEFAKLTVVISKYNKKAIAFCDSIKVPNILFYEDIVKEYKAQIPNWED